ncbi:hypothetical protein [Buttiauxella sp. B2]|uniref:hypothetical protein n=1 Tax=Buttiauxella sp. B2 TaxID=2587812 RepID=UPI00167AC385|nr:hypothetical protein [Buttiauxella sp. B2]
MKLLDFDEMITPKILTSLYIFTTLAAIAFAVILLSSGHIGGAIVMALVVVFNRIFFEFIIVAFKNNEYLKGNNDYLCRIAEAIEKGAAITAIPIDAHKDADFPSPLEPSQDKQ